MSGYIKINRNLFDSDLWQSEPFTRSQAWIDLIQLARYRDGVVWIGGHALNIKRGETVMSELSYAKRWKWSRGKVRRFLNELEKVQQIVQRKDNITSYISILNYDTYQDGGTTNGHQKDNVRTSDGHLTDTRRTSDGHLTVHNRRKEKKERKVNKEKKENKGIPTYEVFKDYVLNKIGLDKFNKIEDSLNLKYQSWIANDWKDGNNKKIVNWNTKILNTIPYLKKSEVSIVKKSSSKSLAEIHAELTK